MKKEMNNVKNLQILNQLIDELISVLISADRESADDTKPSHKNSYPYSVYLAKTIKEYLNDTIA